MLGVSPEPSSAILDSQSVRTTGVGGPARGCDGGKKRAKARKRHLLVDAGGRGRLAWRRAGGVGPARGCDGGKKRAKARKRHLLVDAGGLVLLAYVHAANLRDRAGA